MISKPQVPETQITASWETILKKYPYLLILILHCYPETHLWLGSDSGLKRPSGWFTMDILIFITKDGILSMASTLSRGPIFLKVIQILPENVMFKPKPQCYHDIPFCNCSNSGFKQNSWKIFTNPIKQLSMISVQKIQQQTAVSAEVLFKK